MYFLILTVITFFLYKANNCDVQQNTKIIIKSNEKLKELEIVSEIAINSKDFESFIKLIDTFGIIIPYVGPIASAVSDIFNGNKEMNSETLIEIKNKLDVISTALFTIDRKLDKIIEVIKDNAVINEYKENVIKLYYLQESYNRFLDSPTITHSNEFIKKCKDIDLMDIALYLKIKVIDENTDEIYEIMGKEFHIKQYTSWTMSLTLNLIDIGIFRAICVAFNNSDHNDVTNTLKADLNTLKQITSNLSIKLRAGYNYIQEHFWEYELGEINHYMAKHTKMSHDTFSSTLHRKLKNKYYFRNWFVGSYNSKAKGYSKHGSLSGNYSKHWLRIHNRSLFVSSTINNVNFDSLNNNCINTIGICRGCDCRDIFVRLKSCVNPFEAILVVRFGNGLKFVKHDDISSINHSIDGRNYSIIVVK